MADKLIIEITDNGADAAIAKLDKLKTAAVELGTQLGKLKTSSSALNELKTALAGTKQGATALEELGAAMKQLNVATNSMKSTLSASIRGLGTILKSEMNQLREVVKESGMGIGKGIGEGVTAGTPQAVNAIKRQGQTIAAAAKAEADKIYKATINPQIQPVPQVRAAVNSTASAVLSGGPKPIEIDNMSAAMRRLAVTGNDVHSMSRGLASGFGALWLTWGNLLPLFAGAAISNGFMKTAKEGLQVAHSLETIAILGENTKKEMGLLTAEMINLGNNGIHGPMAIAEAMKTLSLAGLKANEILAVTGTVMNFSLAGTTSIETAADVLVSVTTAFGTGAAGFSRSADIIMRAAADSKASVESFGEAMKTASVVGEQYGASQVDVALQIEYLANLGIQGSAAGTAVRNMYADITGRSGQVTKIMKSLGLDFKDVEGNVLSLDKIVLQLQTKLSEFDAKSKGNIIQALFGERGAKSIVAAMAAANTTIVDESGKTVSKLTADQEKLQNAYGSSAIAGIKMAETSQNAFKSAGATLETTLFQAFQNMEPQLYLAAEGIKRAFGSPELVSALSTLVSKVADFTLFVVENIKTITMLVAAYAGVKLVIALLASFYGTYQTALKGVAVLEALALARTTAKTAADLESAAALGVRSAAERAAATSTAAAAAASVAGLTTMGGLLAILPMVVVGITLAAGAWMAYKMWSSKANGATDEYVNTKAENIIEALAKEADHLEKVNGFREKGLTLIEAESRAKLSAAKTEALTDTTVAYTKAKAANTAARDRGRVLDQALASPKNSGPTRSIVQSQIDRNDKLIEATEMEMQKALKTSREADAQFDKVEARIRAASKRKEELNVKEAADAKKKTDADIKLALGGNGLKGWDLADFQKGAGRTGGTAAADGEKKKLENFYATTMKGMADNARDAEIANLGLSESYKKLIRIIDDPLYQELDEPLKKSIIAAAALAITKEQDAEATKKQMAATQAAIVVQEQLDDVAKGYARTLAAIGMGKNEREKAQGLNQIKDKYDTDLRALRKGPTEEFDEKFAALQEFHAKSQAAFITYYDALKAKESDWALGGLSAIRNYADESANVFAQTESAVTNAFKGMEDALVNFAMTGKLDFKSLANSIIADLIRIQIRAAAVSFLSNMFSGGMQASFSNTSMGSSGFGSGMAYGNQDMGQYFAKGGAFNSPSLSAYSNQVHNSPKPFAFAKGAGVFGEAGPEAIMPLTRTSDGNLGVRAIGGTGSSSSGDIKIEIINNGAPAEATATSEKQPDGSVMIRVILQAVAEDMSSGGMTARATAGRFGLANN